MSGPSTPRIVNRLQGEVCSLQVSAYILVFRLARGVGVRDLCQGGSSEVSNLLVLILIPATLSLFLAFLSLSLLYRFVGGRVPRDVSC